MDDSVRASLGSQLASLGEHSPRWQEVTAKCEVGERFA